MPWIRSLRRMAAWSIAPPMRSDTRLWTMWEKGLSLATGQCNVKAYNRYLRDLIIAGKAKPSFVVSHEIEIDDAEMAYDKFDKRIEGYTKVLIHPNVGF